jgi:hypothetical protein
MTSSAQVISNVAVTNSTSNSAVITWTTDQPSSSLVSYGVTASYGSSSSLNPQLTTAHSVTLSGLTANTLYNFAVTSSANSNSASTSANFRLATLSLSPAIGNINVIYVTSSSATINWTTDQPATALVNYGPINTYGLSSPLSSTLATAHTVTLNGLAPGTTYNYSVVSSSPAGVESNSANQTFTTAAASATAPNVGFVASYGFTNSSAILSWSTDVPASTQLAYGTTTALGQLTPLQTQMTVSHGLTLTGLSPGTTYYFVAESTGAGGATGYSTVFSLTTTGPPSLSPAISNVTVSPLLSTSATLTWQTDAPSTSQVNYGTTPAYGLSSPLDSTLTTAHSVTLTGLTPDTLYDFQLVSVSTTGASLFGANMTGLTVWAWGDSLTLGYGDLTQNTYPLYLATQIGVSVNNEGIGGATSTQIAQAMLSTPASFTAGNCSVIWSGANNHNAVSTVLADITSMVDALASPACFLVMGDINDEMSPKGSLDYNSVLSTNQSLAAQYPAHYLNIRQLLVQAYNPALALDQQSFAEDIPAYSLHAVRPQGTITSGALNNTSCAISVSSGTNGAGTVIIIDSETILINAIPDTVDITSCTRGYNGTAAASHLAGASYSLIDPVHLGSNGYDFVARQVAAWFSAHLPLTFTTPGASINGPNITAVAASSVTATSAVITWTTAQPATSLVNYGVSTSYGGSSALNSALTTAHSVALTGLAPNTLYNFDVVSANSSAASSTSANLTFTTPATSAAAPHVGYVASWGISGSSATVSWSTDVPANTQLAYATTPALGQLSPIQTALTASHGVVLTGLTSGTTYYFVAQSTGVNGATGYSATGSFTTTGTPPAAGAPVLSAITATNITSTAVTITWTTDQPSNSEVSYGLTAAYGSVAGPDASLVTSHSITLTGLTAGATYNFDVVSSNAAGLSSTSANSSFSTAAADATSPSVGYLAVWGINNSGATITWSTDVAANTQLAYGTSTPPVQLTPVQTALTASHGVTLTGLTSGTTYYFVAQSTGVNGASGYSAIQTFTTTGAPPVNAAPLITAVASANITGASATITWLTDQASSSQVNYGLTTAYGSSSALAPALVTSHSVMLTGLTPNTTYNFDVVSSNSAGTAATSASYTFTTQAASASAPAISDVAFWGVTSSSVIISWSTDLLSNTAVQYGTSSALGHMSPVQTALSTSHGITLTGLAASTTYYFAAQSAGSSGSAGSSATYTFTTLAGPPVISAVAALPATGNTAAISWTTSVPTSSYVQFGSASGSYNRYSTQTSLTAHPACALGYVPSGTIFYQLVSTDASGNQTLSPEGVFTEP